MQKEEVSQKFNEHAMFTYDYYKKLGAAIGIYFLIVASVLFCAYYFFFLRTADNFFVNSVNLVLEHVSSNIKEFSMLGGFYASFFGGLFFIPFPTELVYIGFLRAGQGIVVMGIVFLLGIVLSYWLNYQIGYWLSGISKKLIGARTFYKTKIFFNKYGPLGIFLFNVVPLPSQPLCTVLGVFNYNRKKFWFYTMLGEVIKFAAMTIGYFYIT